MKKLIIGSALLFAATGSLATEEFDPVVAEYQKIANLERLAPSMASILVTVNAGAANACYSVMEFKRLAELPDVAGLLAYTVNNGQDGSKEYLRHLDDSIKAVCKILLHEQVESISKSQTNWDEIKPNS